MKRVTCYFMAVCVCTSVSFGAFDHVISDTYEYGVFRLRNSESLLVTGAGAYIINAEDSSYVEVKGTGPLQENVGGIYALSLDDNSSLNWYAGEMGSFDIVGNATAVLQGGRIDYISSRQYVLSPNQNYIPHIEIICREYDDSNQNLITGIWDVDNDNNGEYDMFSINLVDQPGYDPAIDNIKFTIIPEPATLLLVGVGGVLLRRKR